MVEPLGWVERGDIPITSSRQHADVPACRRNFIAGCGFCFERLQVVQQGDGFRKGSTHPYRLRALHGPVIVAMVAVRMVQPAVHEIVEMVTMRHRFMPAVWTVHV